MPYAGPPGLPAGGSLALYPPRMEIEAFDGETFGVSLAETSKGESKLVEYWTKGEGAAKIGWGTDGSFDRCVAKLSKYFPKDPQGLCSNLHKKATGEWPTEGGKSGIPS